MAFKNKPSVCLIGHDLRQLHRIGKNDNCQYGQSDRQFIADHLCPTSHSPNQGIFIITRPPRQQNADNSHRRNRHNKESTYIEINDFQTFGKRQATECNDRSNDDNIRRQIE